ncbi:hypothetical protein BDQ17DRAFT_1330844 [Cyathus striatus]|nr:hypothetical protein BDQ17DRAFT_1330844 [Cyathus striatus]
MTHNYTQGSVFNLRQPKEVFAIPIATLFTFTSLRGMMPGAPSGFGATMVALSNAKTKDIQFEPSIFPMGKKDLEAATQGSNLTSALTVIVPPHWKVVPLVTQDFNQYWN